MCDCNAYDNGHCYYFDVEVGELTHGCTRGKMQSKSKVIVQITQPITLDAEQSEYGLPTAI
jgi:hypothetical protein